MKHKIVINTRYGGYIWTEPVRKWFKKRGIECCPKDRHNKLLVQCIEELGSDAEDKYGRPIIVEIEGDTYLVKDYDGSESVITPDKVKWVKIEED
jgi:hypothetical protein